MMHEKNGVNEKPGQGDPQNKLGRDEAGDELEVKEILELVRAFIDRFSARSFLCDGSPEPAVPARDRTQTENRQVQVCTGNKGTITRSRSSSRAEKGSAEPSLFYN